MFTAEYDYDMDIEVQREEALERGMEKGKLEGIQQGMQQGIHKNQKNIVLNMVSKGFDMQTISESTDLDIWEVQKIKENS